MTTTNETELAETPAEDVAAKKFLVVGVDGSECSAEALKWAAEEAQLRGLSLRVVRAWQLPTLAYAGVAYLPAPACEDMADDVATELGLQVTAVLGEHPAVPFQPEVTEGPTAQVLLDATRGAEMIVVGSHGRGGFTGLLLGSVSAQVAHHAHCPVVIVRS